MARAHRFWPALLLGLLSCNGGQENNRAAVENAETDQSPVSALERAAVDAGIVADVRSVSPVGLYRNRHEAGLDSLCIVAGDGEEINFGLEAVFGRGIECRGRGTLRVSGDKLILNFARSACLVVAQYDGDGVALPGTLDVECSKLCTERGSLEGTSFPRVSRDEAVARDARAKNRSRLCL